MHGATANAVSFCVGTFQMPSSFEAMQVTPIHVHHRTPHVFTLTRIK